MTKNKFWYLCKKLWWLLATLVGALAIFLFRRKARAEEISLDDALAEKTPSFSTHARERIDQALVDAKVDSALIQEQSAAKRKDLQDIRKDKDEKARLAKLASYLQKNI